MEAVEVSASSPRLESASSSTCLSSQYAAGRMPVRASVPVSGEGDLDLDVDVAGAGEVSLGDDALCCCSLIFDDSGRKQASREKMRGGIENRRGGRNPR